MKLVKINDSVFMYPEPVFGTIIAEQRVMAISIDKSKEKPYKGLAREITKSRGNPDVPGFVDESKLIIVESQDGLKWKKKKDLEIKRIDEILHKLAGDDKYFIGLEDPDIYDENGLNHVYFTIAFKYKDKVGYAVYLGHAEGKSLESLNATKPVLSPFNEFRGFKEVMISPVNKQGYRMNLSEAQMVVNDDEFSITVLSKAKQMGGSWDYEKIAIDPRKMKYSWCKGETSPVILFSRDFISSGKKDLLVGIINGREPKMIVDGKKVFGKFRPGLILYNPETGDVPWVAPECLFEDPDARSITFSSEFLRTGKKEGILYAHINDSFIRAYKLDASKLKNLLPNNR
jgi:hypothetical protein